MRKLNDEYLAGFFDADGCAQLNAYWNKSGREVIQFMTLIKWCQHDDIVLSDIHHSLGLGKIRKYSVQINKLDEIRKVLDRFLDLVIYKRPQLLILKRYIEEISHKRGHAWTIEDKKLGLDLVIEMRKLNMNHKSPYKYSIEDLQRGLDLRIQRSKEGNAYIPRTT